MRPNILFITYTGFLNKPTVNIFVGNESPEKLQGCCNEFLIIVYNDSLLSPENRKIISMYESASHGEVIWI